MNIVIELTRKELLDSAKANLLRSGGFPADAIITITEPSLIGLPPFSAPTELKTLMKLSAEAGRVGSAAGNKIAMIKACRALADNQLGLKEAKDLVESVFPPSPSNEWRLFPRKHTL